MSVIGPKHIGEERFCGRGQEMINIHYMDGEQAHLDQWFIYARLTSGA